MTVKEYSRGLIEYDPGDGEYGWFSVEIFPLKGEVHVSVGSNANYEVDVTHASIIIPIEEFKDFQNRVHLKLTGDNE